MIERTFAHLPGISRRGEEKLWRLGIEDWNAFLRAERIQGIGTERKIALDRMLRADRTAFESDDQTRFHAWPLSLHHRALAHIERIIYLDIETYGVRARSVTIIAISDGENVHLIDGTRADRSALDSILSRAEAIVTFNGNRFDLPYLERSFGYTPACFRIDLEPLARRAGLVGGLKRIERGIGIIRDRDLRGGDPLALWRSYRATGDEHFLELLFSYAEQDVLSLPVLLEHVRLENRDGRPITS